MAGSGCGFGNTTQDAINNKEAEAVAEEAQVEASQRDRGIFEVFIIHETAAEVSSELPRVNLPRVHFGISIYS